MLIKLQHILYTYKSLTIKNDNTIQDVKKQSTVRYIAYCSTSWNTVTAELSYCKPIIVYVPLIQQIS